MKSKASVRQQLHSALQIFNVAAITVIILFVLSGISLAQSQLPFIGTRTFCGNFLGSTAIVSIRKDGFTTVKTTMMPVDRDRYVTFTGKLNAKGTLKLNSEYYLNIKSEAKIILLDYVGQIEVMVDEGVPCSEVFSDVSGDVQRLLTTPNSEQNKDLPAKEMMPDVLVANLYAQEGQVFQTQSRAWLDRYFEKNFANLIWKALVDAESSEEGFGGDILLNFAQDAQIKNFVIGKPTYKNQKAQVSVSWENFGIKDVMVFLLATGKTGWKITDIKYDGGKTSLVAAYSKDFPKEGEAVQPTPTTKPVSKLPVKKNANADVLGAGPTMLFKGTKSKLSNQDKQWIFEKMEFSLSRNKKFLVVTDECGDASPNVDIKDFNADGVEEVLIIWGNTCYAGMGGMQSNLFVKDRSGQFVEVLNAIGGANELKKRNKGFPDLELGRQGFCFNVMQWNGTKYEYKCTHQTNPDVLCDDGDETRICASNDVLPKESDAVQPTPSTKPTSKLPVKTAVGTFIWSESGTREGEVCLKIEGKEQCFFYLVNGTKWSPNFRAPSDAWKPGAEWRITYSPNDQNPEFMDLISATFTGRVIK